MAAKKKSGKKVTTLKAKTLSPKKAKAVKGGTWSPVKKGWITI